MEINVIKKPEKNVKDEIKILSDKDVIYIKHVQEIRNAIREHLLFIGLDGENNVRNINLIGIGTSNNIVIDIKEIVRLALFNACSKVILVHNHPSNSLNPSKEDLHITTATNQLLKAFNITLLDHIIVTEKEYVSMYQLEKLDFEKNKKEFEIIDKAMLLEENKKLKEKINMLEKSKIAEKIKLISFEYIGGYNDNAIYNVKMDYAGKIQDISIEKSKDGKCIVYSENELSDSEKDYIVEDFINYMEKAKQDIATKENEIEIGE